RAARRAAGCSAVCTAALGRRPGLPATRAARAGLTTRQIRRRLARVGRDHAGLVAARVGAGHLLALEHAERPGDAKTTAEQREHAHADYPADPTATTRPAAMRPLVVVEGPLAHRPALIGAGQIRVELRRPGPGAVGVRAGRRVVDAPRRRQL